MIPLCNALERERHTGRQSIINDASAKPDKFTECSNGTSANAC
eukprot:COSAG02_NODE_3598_length_6507_cov_15.869538_7_plen_43_part_00